jgi:hypothetical protein
MTAQNVKLIFIFIAAQEEKKALEEAEEQFTCKDGSTIPETHYCDDLFDCPDNSDEINCTPGKLKLVNQFPSAMDWREKKSA